MHSINYRDWSFSGTLTFLWFSFFSTTTKSTFIYILSKIWAYLFEKFTYYFQKEQQKERGNQWYLEKWLCVSIHSSSIHHQFWQASSGQDGPCHTHCLHSCPGAMPHAATCLLPHTCSGYLPFPCPMLPYFVPDHYTCLPLPYLFCCHLPSTPTLTWYLVDDLTCGCSCALLPACSLPYTQPFTHERYLPPFLPTLTPPFLPVPACCFAVEEEDKEGDCLCVMTWISLPLPLPPCLYPTFLPMPSMPPRDNFTMQTDRTMTLWTTGKEKAVHLALFGRYPITKTIQKLFKKKQKMENHQGKTGTISGSIHLVSVSIPPLPALLFRFDCILLHAHSHCSFPCICWGIHTWKGKACPPNSGCDRQTVSRQTGNWLAARESLKTSSPTSLSHPKNSLLSPLSPPNSQLQHIGQPLCTMWWIPGGGLGGGGGWLDSGGNGRHPSHCPIFIFISAYFFPIVLQLCHLCYCCKHAFCIKLFHKLLFNKLLLFVHNMQHIPKLFHKNCNKQQQSPPPSIYPCVR